MKCLYKECTQNGIFIYILSYSVGLFPASLIVEVVYPIVFTIHQTASWTRYIVISFVVVPDIASFIY